MTLHNKLSRPELIVRLNNETFKRRTLSFYRYVNIAQPKEFRDMLYLALDQLQCNGRIYVAAEGVNAQMNLPESNIERFLSFIKTLPELAETPLKWALEDDGRSFLKLIVRVRPKIVADGLTDKLFDTTNVGTRLSPMEFHRLSQNENVLVVDMRNKYESEVGRFVNALCPDAETFRQEVEMVVDQLADQKEQKILLYCTGGVRCEKASAWLKHHGFKDVNQLHGGIIAYVSEIKQNGLEPRFIGKNFVFDERLGERVTPHILSQCHQCGQLCDTHVNCAYDPCHDLVIQCDACRQKYAGCCSDSCHDRLQANPEKHKHQQLHLMADQTTCSL